MAHLLQHNASKIYLLSNKEEHAEEAQEELKKYGDAGRVEWKKCNLEDLKQVDEVAKELSSLEKLDGLILNAGLGVGVYNETKDGIGMSRNFPIPRPKTDKHPKILTCKSTTFPSSILP